MPKLKPLLVLHPVCAEQVDQAISLCSEMHDIKEAIYENKNKLEGIGEDYQIQVCDNILFFLIVFGKKTKLVGRKHSVQTRIFIS